MNRVLWIHHPLPVYYIKCTVSKEKITESGQKIINMLLTFLFLADSGISLAHVRI